jgi:APA family basic amino acid/polyamine antiporter
LKPLIDSPSGSRGASDLKRVLGVTFGIAVLVGGTIGSGILRNPGTIAELVNNYWLIIACWVFGGIYVLLGAGAYSELATMFPKAGGAYNYVKAAFGNYPGFITGWYDFISNGIGPSYFCILIGEYLVLLFPSLAGNATVIAIAFLIAFTLLHLTGVKTGSIAQQITSLIKVICFAALIIACFVYSGTKINNDSASVDVVVKGTVLFGFMRALQLVIGTYSGWNATCFFAEEDKNPSRNIPRALYSGAFIVILIYVLLNIAFLNVLPPSSLAGSQLAASDVAKVIFGSDGAILVTVIALFSIVGILNAYMMIPARILFGMSRDGFFVRQGAQVNKKGTPTFSLIFSAIVNLTLISIGSFNTLFGLSAFMSVTVFTFVYASQLRLRITKPDLHRPFRSWGFPITTIVLILISLGLFAGFAFSDPQNFIVVLAVTVLSYPAYFLLRRRK